MVIHLLPFAGGDSRVPLFSVLSHYTNPDKAELLRRPDGKPELVAPDGSHPLYFNLSHSGGLLAVAVDDREVGVDIETLSRRLHPALARRMLSQTEQEALADEFGPLPQTAPLSEALTKRLLTLWTLKEALTKATGTGLRTDYRSLTLQACPDGSYVCPAVPGIRLRSFVPAPGFVGAVAWTEG